MDLQVVKLLNFHPESVSQYVHKLNKCVIDGLLERRHAPGKNVFL